MSPHIIDPATLAELLSEPGACSVLDVRWRLGGPPCRPDYLAGHLPGARFLDLDTELAAPPGEHGRHPLPESDVLVGALRRAGVSRGTPVVVYDERTGMLAAARAWWLLRDYGHPDVRVLDGGLAAWRDAGLPVEKGEPGTGEGDFTGAPGTMPAIDRIGAGSWALENVLLDARAVERYRGDVEPIDPVAGHIPGARSLPTAALLADDGRLLPPDEIQERLRAATGGLQRPLAAYCGSGVTAAHLVLAAASAGIPVALYPGSWSEWVAVPGAPAVCGDDPGA